MRDEVVIIGAGIGGLVAAALLAARGAAVTVVEAATTPGGKVRQIDGVDAGPTVFTLREVFDEVFDACGDALERRVTLRPAAVLARHAWGQDRLDLFADPARSEAAIGDFAGAAEARGYRAFRAESKRIFDALDGTFMRRGNTNPIGLSWRLGLRNLPDLFALRPYESLWSALGGHFRDARLRQLFARYATYAGSSPFESPATLMLIAHAEARGVWLIEGGMSALVDALAALAEANGAHLRYGERVEEIIVERGRAHGVRLVSGEPIAAGSVIWNGDPAALASGALGDEARKAAPASRGCDRSQSALVWTGRVEARGFPLARHNVCFSDDYPAEFAALSRGALADRPSVYVCAQDRDDTHVSAPATERIQIIVNAPPVGGALSQQEIDRCERRMRERLACSGLSLQGDLSVTTPGDFATLFPSTNGALYGPASHGWAASFRRQGARTRIPGLYCAGGSTHPGAGVPMAALSARLAVDCWLKDRASMSRSRPAAMPGGMSTRSAKTAATG